MWPLGRDGLVQILFDCIYKYICVCLYLHTMLYVIDIVSFKTLFFHSLDGLDSEKNWFMLLREGRLARSRFF